MQKLSNKKRLARKGVKWIESRFSIAHRMRITVSAFRRAGIVAAGLAQANAIKASNTDKIGKCFALADLAIKTTRAISYEITHSHSAQ